jgi:hypothetical protein
MQLLSEAFSTAFDPRRGLYLQSLSGTAVVSGPPLDVIHLDLAVDEPCWRRVDPRRVDFHAGDLARFHRQNRPGRNVLPDDDPFTFEARPRRPEPLTGRAAAHLRWLCRLFGPRRLRRLHSLPAGSLSAFLLLWLAHRAADFDQLLLDAPMLALLVAGFPQDNDLPLDDLVMAVREDCRLPRREVLAMRGLPPEASRGFGRITPAGANLALVGALRKSLRDPTIRKRWNHARAIGPNAIRIFADERLFRCVSGRFLAELAREDRRCRDDVFALMLNQFAALRAVGETSAGRCFDSLGALERWHERAGLSLNTSYLEEILHLEFPRAPFAGDEDCIEQLLNGKDLMREALCMRHCVAAGEYVDAMLGGRSYLFRAGGWGLERCTIEVQRRPAQRRAAEETAPYAVTQVRGPGNRDVSKRTMGALRVWAEMQEIGFALSRPGEAPDAGDDGVPF